MTHLAPLPEYRTIWISDLHLGTRGCKAEFLLDFLKYTEAETLYLVGDIIDGWRLRKSWYWPQAHNDVIQKVLRKAPARIPVLVAVGLSQAAGQERDAIHRLLCRCRCRRGPPPRGRRCRLRPHPPRRAAPDRRHSLLQQRRLGRELHRPRRAFR